MGVYAGRYLRVNLTNCETKVVPISDQEVRNYLLGDGFAAWLYYQEMDPDLEPLDPKSPLYIFNGVLTGTFGTTASRTSFAGRSPLTGIWGEANIGGDWGAMLRFSGYDGIVITGKAPRPVYLWIDGVSGKVECRPAEHLWGKGHFDTYDIVRSETNPKAEVASIGQAGERLVKYAAIMQGGNTHARAAGRTGMGAVMGSKNLKAIAVYGKERPTYADVKGFREWVKWGNEVMHSEPSTQGMSALGTVGGLAGAEAYGDLPIKNWMEGSWSDGAAKTTGTALEKYLVKHTFCHACPIGCGKIMEIKEGKYAMYTHWPEYETAAGFGALILNDDVEALSEMNRRANDYGFDTISLSSVVAFAIEAYEAGLITKEDTGGLELRWGGTDCVLELIEMIVERRGIGDLLAEGTRAAAEKLGEKAIPMAVHVKGLEAPYHDPRTFTDMAAHYATNPRGASHMEAASYWYGYGLRIPGWREEDRDRFSSEGAAQLAIDFQNYMQVFNPLGVCKFIVKAKYAPDHLAKLVSLATGWDWSGEELLRKGAELFNLKRLIDIRLGVTPADDTLPPRLLTHPRPSGSGAGNLPDMEYIMREYYAIRKWDPKTGAPLPEAPLPPLR